VTLYLCWISLKKHTNNIRIDDLFWSKKIEIVKLYTQIRYYRVCDFLFIVHFQHKKKSSLYLYIKENNPTILVDKTLINIS